MSRKWRASKELLKDVISPTPFMCPKNGTTEELQLLIDVVIVNARRLYPGWYSSYREVFLEKICGNVGNGDRKTEVKGTFYKQEELSLYQPEIFIRGKSSTAGNREVFMSVNSSSARSLSSGSRYQREN